MTRARIGRTSWREGATSEALPHQPDESRPPGSRSARRLMSAGTTPKRAEQGQEMGLGDCAYPGGGRVAPGQEVEHYQRGVRPAAIGSTREVLGRREVRRRVFVRDEAGRHFVRLFRWLGSLRNPEGPGFADPSRDGVPFRLGAGELSVAATALAALNHFLARRIIFIGTCMEPLTPTARSGAGEHWPLREQHHATIARRTHLGKRSFCRRSASPEAQRDGSTNNISRCAVTCPAPAGQRSSSPRSGRS